MQQPKVTLDQWRVLQSVVDCGGYAQAAEYLNRSQSSVSYTISKLQKQLGLPVLEIDGRKARLTEAGQALLLRSRQLILDATELESLAHTLEQGWEPEIRLVVDAAFPNEVLMEALNQFVPVSKGTRVQFNEVVLSGADEALLDGQAELVIGMTVPQGFLGDLLIEVEFIAVAHHSHPLHLLDRDLTIKDLRREVQLVIRDSGRRLNHDMGWLGSEHRWTVTSIDNAAKTARAGLGFGWLPRHQIQEQLDSGELLPLRLTEGLLRQVHLHPILGHPDRVGPATRVLAEIFTTICKGQKYTGRSN
jgi:DNA-binding transcriptional LysR family regulator